jgi:hypothetical protein
MIHQKKNIILPWKNNNFPIKQGIRNILLNNIVLHYNNNKSLDQRLKNLKNFGLLEKSLNVGGEDLEVKYNDEKYIFKKIDDPYSKIVSYILFSINEKDNCVVISIDKKTHIANIDNLSSNGLKCSYSVITEVGKHLVKITIKLLKKYKDKLNINKIVLTDHSFLFCESIKNNIELSQLYTLKHGHTFYGALGFLPFNDKLLKKYKNNNNIIKNLLVKDSYLSDQKTILNIYNNIIL